jgi:hypothetical protein
MENCLVTKLKGTVDNVNLSKIGELVVKTKGNIILTSENAITVRANKNAISLVNGGPYSNSVNVPAGMNPATQIYVSEECTVFIPKYYLHTITINPSDNIDLNFTGEFDVLEGGVGFGAVAVGTKFDLGIAPKKLVNISASNYTISFNGDSYPILKKVSFESTNKDQVINISDLVSKAPLLEEYRCYSNYQNGTFEGFGNAKRLNLIYGFNGTGTMEGFVAAQRLASGDREARTTGSANLMWCGNITFQGVSNLVLGSVKTLSWTADTITFDGTTINA